MGYFGINSAINDLLPSPESRSASTNSISKNLLPNASQSGLRPFWSDTPRISANTFSENSSRKSSRNMNRLRDNNKPLPPPLKSSANSREQISVVSVMSLERW